MKKQAPKPKNDAVPWICMLLPAASPRLSSDGTAREIACYGTRGDGKTFAALIAMLLHALKHSGFVPNLPFPHWFAITRIYECE
jgi:hypothetical protein